MATAVLPVWRSPMISSRWPRPIGIRVSMAFRPVCTGSCTDLRGMMPGRLHVDAAALFELDRALAVDRLAQRVDDAAQQALAHRHVHDLAEAADFVAFLDLGVGPEDHDADVVALKVQGHALNPGVGELHHLAGLDLVEAVDAGDAVADRQHLADVGDVGFFAEVGDLGLEDGRDFGGADVHGGASLLRRASGRISGNRASTSARRRTGGSRRAPKAAEDRRVDARGEFRVLAERLAQRGGDALQLVGGEGQGGGHFGGDRAALLRPPAG